MKHERGFVADALLLLRLAMGIAGVLAGWFLWGQFTDWIQAPVVARAERAESANESLVKTNVELKADNDRLDKIITLRVSREGKSEAKLEGRKNVAENLAAKNPEVKAWRDAFVPDALIESDGLWTVSGQTASRQGRAPSGQGAGIPDPSRQPSGPASAGLDKRATVGPDAHLGDTSQPVQQPAGRCTGVDAGICGVYNRTLAKMKGATP